uniref:uncharacterized protein LOC105352743 n=1 Tax=Fragaria vesca subsp. vesca TaxID=101020 RepID=UPI0005C8F522|nr:PREDICTED: uncharacterized protein LOC105352743 [Fragaria vesca subsp. vesca]
MSEEKMKVPLFDGHYYDYWSELMENLLKSKGLWSLVENGFDEPTAGALLTEAQREQLEDARAKDHKVKRYLFQAIDRVTFEQILDRRTAKIVWESMKIKFVGNYRVKKSILQKLRRDFEVLEMKNSESISEYFVRVMAITNKMRSNGEEMPESKVVEKVLRTLTERFTYVVISIEESKNTESISIDELQSSLVIHEQKFQRHDKGENQVLKMSHEDRFGYECPKWNKEANYAELDETEELLLMSLVEECEAERGDVWFLDSGCSNHMCGDKSMFSSLNDKFNHSVKLGNNTRMQVAGKGSVRLTMKGVAFVISDVYYVPELKNNLLSIGKLQEKGLAILIQGGV